MIYTITKDPHPLDAVWSDAIEALSDADVAMDELGNDYTDQQLDEAGAVRTAAIMTIMALPARNLSDSLFKLDCAGVCDGNARNDCDPKAIMTEALAVLDAAIARGRRSDVVED